MWRNGGAVNRQFFSQLPKEDSGTYVALGITSQKAAFDLVVAKVKETLPK